MHTYICVSTCILSHMAAREHRNWTICPNSLSTSMTKKNMFPDETLRWPKIQRAMSDFRARV